MIHVRTTDQIADIFTEFLTGQYFVVHGEHNLGALEGLGVRDRKQPEELVLHLLI